MNKHNGPDSHNRVPGQENAMRDYLVKTCVMVVLAISCFHAVRLSASPHSYWYSVYSIILFSLEISVTYSLFAKSEKWIQALLGWLFLAHGVYPLSMVFLPGLAGLETSNMVVLVFALLFVGGAMLLLMLPPISIVALHGWRNRFFPVAFFVTYLPGALLMGKNTGSDGPANEAGLLFSIILLLMAISVVWRKAIDLVAHVIILFAISYIVGYTIVIPPRQGLFPVFLVFPVLFIVLYVGLTIRDKRSSASE